MWSSARPAGLCFPPQWLFCFSPVVFLSPVAPAFLRQSLLVFSGLFGLIRALSSSGALSPSAPPLSPIRRSVDPPPGQVSGTDGKPESQESRLCLQAAL